MHFTATFTDGKFSQFDFFCSFVSYELTRMCLSTNDRVLLWNRFASLVPMYSDISSVLVIGNQNSKVSNFNFHELKYLKLKKSVSKRTGTGSVHCAHTKKRYKVSDTFRVICARLLPSQ